MADGGAGCLASFGDWPDGARKGKAARVFHPLLDSDSAAGRLHPRSVIGPLVSDCRGPFREAPNTWRCGSNWNDHLVRFPAANLLAAEALLRAALRIGRRSLDCTCEPLLDGDFTVSSQSAPSKGRGALGGD